MPTFEKHKDASTRLQEGIADSSYDALKDLGATLKTIGAKLAGDHAIEQPRVILADAIVSVASVHARFRERALDAVAKALQIVK
jgi:hypothetical protein